MIWASCPHVPPPTLTTTYCTISFSRQTHQQQGRHHQPFAYFWEGPMAKLSPLRSPASSRLAGLRYRCQNLGAPQLLCGQLCFWVSVILVHNWYTASAGDVRIGPTLMQQEQEKGQANVVRLSSVPGGMPGGDKRGWIMSPLHAAEQHQLGGARVCRDVHVGTVKAGHTRANHRHHAKNESFLVWGAAARWRLESESSQQAFAEATFEPHEVAVFTAPKGRAHALTNLDKSLTLNLMVCADADWDPSKPDTDYGVWSDL
eukprot:jgi/Mesen1/7267/ME000373S06333